MVLSVRGFVLSFSPLKLSDAGLYTCCVDVYTHSFQGAKNLTIREGGLGHDFTMCAVRNVAG